MNSTLTRLVFLLIALSSLSASAAAHYVDLNNPNPAPPFLSWADAATNIQDAVDAANPGDLVLVTNGLYVTGDRSIPPAIERNRVAITKPLTVRSVNGPMVTTIQGQQTPGSIIGPNSIRCVYLTNGAMLSGFTLTNGAGGITSPDAHEQFGGGVFCEDSSAIVSNCVIASCGGYVGGGAYGGTLKYCVLTNNWAHFAGGGAFSSSVLNCEIVWSTTDYEGAGLAYCMVTNCLIIDSLSLFGAGAFHSTLVQCTLYGNVATKDSLGEGGYGGGENGCAVYNSILISNISTTGGGDNWVAGDYFTNCCTTPMIGGSGNITNSPIFYDANHRNLHLMTNSPGVNTGNNLYAGGSMDLDMRPRIVGAKVEMGAYEVQAGDNALFVPWLRKYHLPTDGTADLTDSDGDGLNNWQEWRADTVPTNPASALRMLTPIPDVAGTTITWKSVNTRKYWIERSAGLEGPSPFAVIATNITGLPGSTSYVDTNSPGMALYRVGVQR